jgi:hypothetical protein
MHIGGALVFDPIAGGGTPAVGEVREHLEQRLQLPRYRQKLSAPRTGGLPGPTGSAISALRSKRTSVMRRSPRRVTSASSWTGSRTSTRIAWTAAVRCGRWRCSTVWCTGVGGGVEDHHCLVDGVGSVSSVDLLLDVEPAPCEPSAPHAAPVSDSVEARPGWLPHPLEPVGQVAGAGLAAARGGSHALMHPREAFERSRAVIDLLVRDELFAAPGSSLSVPIGATRRIATVHVELEHSARLAGRRSRPAR